MSAGHVHTKASIILAVGFTAGTIVITQQASDIQYAIGALIGVMITPDIDVDGGFNGDRYIRYKVGSFAEWIWDGFWYMYRRSLKHGGELSHFPVVSTIGRLVYIYGMLIVVPNIFAYFIADTFIWDTPLWNLWQLLGWWASWGFVFYKIILGLMAADLIHWALDVCTTEHKR